jgi:hypothetical protein
MLPKTKVNGAVKLEPVLVGVCVGAGAIPATRPLVTGVCWAKSAAGEPINMAPKTSGRMRIAPPASIALNRTSPLRSNHTSGNVARS